MSENITSTIADKWRMGQPNRKGWYQCRLDGEEIRLYFFICELNPKKRYWHDTQGRRVDEDVEWLEN